MLRGLLPLIVKSDILLADALLATWWIVAEIRRRVVMCSWFHRKAPDRRPRKVVAWARMIMWSNGLPQRPKWMSLDDYAHCPAMLRVREVEVDGRILITTLLDPKAVTPRELDALMPCAGISSGLANDQGDDGDGCVALSITGND
ncbi:MAG: hypothetical protein IPJ50_02615 [Betaproteobacteria bacterium]|nr:hypothetical protein [Betaproteobacteria bacterium]